MTVSARPRIGAVILAAGPSRRMGQPKLVLTHEGVPLLRRAVDAALGARCDEVVVVLGAHGDLYAPLLNGTPVRIVQNPRYHEGMSSSIQAGIEALAEDVQAAMLMLADQPFIDASIIRRLIDTYLTSGKRIVACQYGAVRGAPTLFDRALFLELLVVHGDQGARQVIEAYPTQVATVEIPLERARDVDTPADVRMLHRED